MTSAVRHLRAAGVPFADDDRVDVASASAQEVSRYPMLLVRPARKLRNTDVRAPLTWLTCSAPSPE